MIVLLLVLNMSTGGDAVKTRETADKTLIDSKLDVTGNLTAKRMYFGTGLCNIGIETVTEGNYSYPEMYVTLPNTYYGKLRTQKYRMRSIIEAIQEINRRTATFGCNVKFDAAKIAFDTTVDADEDPYDQFACNEHEDGLPAASNGEPLTERILNIPYDDPRIVRENDEIKAMTIGIWTYTVLSKDIWCASSTCSFTNLTYKVLNCRLNPEAFKATSLNVAECVIDYSDSPYDTIFIYNKDGCLVEYRTCMYRRALSADLLSTTNVTSVTLRNWNNKYVEVMTGMFENRDDTDSKFAYSPSDTWTMPTDTAFGVTSNIYLYSHHAAYINPFTYTYGGGILKAISFENFNTSFVGRIDRMFYGLFALRTINLNGFSDLKRVWKINDFVKQCGITGIDMSRFTLYPGRYITNIQQEGIHYYVNANGTPYVTYTMSADVAEVNYSIRDMFYNCYLLTELKFPNIDPSNLPTSSDTVGLFNGIGTELYGEQRNPTPFLKEFELDYTMYSIFINAVYGGGPNYFGSPYVLYYNDISKWKNINGVAYTSTDNKQWIDGNDRQILIDPSPLDTDGYSA